MRGAVTIIGFIALAALLALLLIPTQRVIIADGSYELTIRVRSATKSPIKSLTCQAFPELALAQEQCADPIAPHPYEADVARAEPFAGEDLKLTLPFSEHIVTPLFGSAYLKSEFQFRGLLVIATLENGKRVGRAVKIPHRKDSRTIDVEVP
jgi:hypothetical protein